MHTSVCLSPNRLSLLLVLVVGLTGPDLMVAYAQTTSTSSATGFEAPPKCELAGTTRQEVWTVPQVQAGPACIGVGDRDVPNPSPSCEGLPPGNPDPGFGTTVLVPAGTEHVNTHTHTLTLTCVPPTPALPLPWLTGLGLGVLGAGAAMARRRRPAGFSRGASA